MGKNNVFNQQYMQKFYQDILENQNIDKFHDYFTADCKIEINGKRFNAEEFKQRMLWLKNNTKSIKVDVLNIFSSQDKMQFTDSHISSVIDNESKSHKVFNIQQSQIEHNKIKTFTLASYPMTAESDMSLTTAK